MATRSSLRYLTAALIAGLALSLTPPTPAMADEDPGVRSKRVRTYAPRVRTVVRVRYVPVPYSYGCGGCATAVAAPLFFAPRYYAPTYYSGCSCAAPYQWAVRYARHRHAHYHHGHHGYRHRHAFHYGHRHGHAHRHFH